LSLGKRSFPVKFLPRFFQKASEVWSKAPKF